LLPGYGKRRSWLRLPHRATVRGPLPMGNPSEHAS